MMAEKREPLTEDQIVQLVADALDVPTDWLTDDGLESEHPEWDSLDMVKLLLALRQEGIIVEVENVATLRSVAGIIGVFHDAGRLTC
jgi:acyl carrier protein